MERWIYNLVIFKNVKESYPVQVAGYSHHRKLSDEPAFAQWVPHVLKKRDSIIARVKSKYWLCTYKFGRRLPKMVEEAKLLYQQNGNHLWWEAKCEEMKNIRIAFGIFDDQVGDLKGYQFVEFRIIFNIKMGEKF